MQRARFWSWRAAKGAGRALQLCIIGFVLFVGVIAVAEAIHKPIIADKAPAVHRVK